MKQDRWLFEAFVTERLAGTVYEPDEAAQDAQAFVVADQSARQLMGWVNGLQNSNGNTLKVVTGFVERMTPNAVADHHHGVHFIGIHQALLVSMAEFALFAFTQACVFPYIGDAVAENSPELSGDIASGLMLLDRTMAGQSIVSKNDQHRVPKDAQRHVAAIYLSMLMVRYAYMHELAHCVNGHVLFAQKGGLALRLYEVSEELAITGFKNKDITEKQRGRVLEQLEFDADSSAFLGCCNVQLSDQENIDGIKALDIGTRLGLSVFAAYATTWLFEEYQVYFDRQQGLTHPSPYARLQNLVRTAVHDIAPKTQGFIELHNSVCDQFNAMAITGLHKVGQIKPMSSEQEFERHAVQSALVSVQFG